MNAVTAANVGANTAFYFKDPIKIFTAAGQSALPALSAEEAISSLIYMTVQLILYQ